MAIKSVTAANLAEFASAQVSAGNPVASPAEVAVIDATVAPKVEAGVETVSTAPDPGPQPERTSAAEASDEEAPKRNNAWAKMRQELKELDQFAREEFEKRQAAEEKLKTLQAPPTIQADPRPDRTKYTADDAQKYEDDLLAWNRRETRREDAQRAELQRQSANMARNNAQGREAYSDYDEVLRRSSSTVPVHIKAAIIDSDVGGHLAYQLAKDPRLEAEILSLPPAAAILRLGEMSAQFRKKSEAGSPPPPAAARALPPTTKAPEPMPSIVAGAGDVTPDFSKPMGFDEYKRRRIDEQRKTTSRPRYRG